MSRSSVRSARPRARRAVLLAVAGTGAAALLAGCGTGQVTQTSAKVPSVPGVNRDIGDIAVRNALVVPPDGDKYEAGDEAPLDMRVINIGYEADRLTGATSDAAASVEIRAGSTGASGAETVPATCASPLGSLPPSEVPTQTQSAFPNPTGSPSPSATPTEAASPTAGATPTGAASPTAGATPTGTASPGATAPAEQQALVIPPSCLVAVGPEGRQQLVLVELKEDVHAGDVVPVTLEFERAGQVSMELPIGPPPSPLSRSPLPLEEEEGHAE